MNGLTKRQYQTLQFIKSFIKKNGFSPTYEEIAQGIGVAHKSRVFYLLRGLKERGAVSMLPNRQRTIRVVEDA